MAKTIVILLIFILSIQATVGFTQQTNDLKTLKIVGKVKSITEVNIVSKDSNDTYESIFNESKSVKSFNKSGYFLEEKYYEGKNKLKDQYKYIYSSDELLIEKKRKNKDKSKSWIEINFTFFGIFTTDFSRLPAIEKKIYYDYDSVFNIKNEFYLTSKNDLIQEFKYTYNSKNQCIEKIYSNYRNKYSVKTINIYDSLGNNIETKGYRNDKYIGKDINKFDSIGNLIEKTSFGPDGKMSEKLRYKFDSKSNITETIYWDSKGKIIYQKKFVYEFDKIGNWIKCTEFNEGKATYTSIRSIKYFKN